MTLIVLTVLMAAWLGYFALWFREKREARPLRADAMAGMRRFRHDTDRELVLLADIGSRAKPRGELFESPKSPQQAHSRRRQVATALAAVAVASLLVVPVLGAAALAVHVSADMALLLFAFGAVRRHQPAMSSMAEVRVLYPRPLAAEGAVPTPLRQVVNG